MKKISIVGSILLTIAFLFSACSGAQPSQAKKVGAGDTIIVVDQPVSLANMLRRVPSIQIEESGPYTQVFLRGRSPLFVVDGARLGYDFNAVINTVNPNDVTAVEVLRTPSETFMYGRAGQNGVIVFHTGEFDIEQ